MKLDVSRQSVVLSELVMQAGVPSDHSVEVKANALLDAPLKLEHIKPRLLGHWGTTTGLNFIYVHLNRVIKQHDLNMIYVIGPGHGGPGLVAHSYLEGSYTERYPNIERGRNGLERLFRQFSWPYGIPSHVAAETPGSIHEGGELGYVLTHAFGAVFDNPDLVAIAVVGDGESRRVEWTLPNDLRAFCVDKGSIALNGVSLTLNAVGKPGPDGRFTVAITLIPHTWTHTNLRHCALGDDVNVEVDVLAKYVERLCHAYLTPSNA